MLLAAQQLGVPEALREAKTAALFNLMVGAYAVDEIVGEIRSAGFKDVSLIAQDPEHGRGLVTATRP